MTTDIIIDILFSLGLLICIWYFFIKERTLEKLEINDELTIKLDDYEKELSKITKYPNAKPIDKTDWKSWDREQLSNEDYETLYQETKSGEKIVD